MTDEFKNYIKQLNDVQLYRLLWICEKYADNEEYVKVLVEEMNRQGKKMKTQKIKLTKLPEEFEIHVAEKEMTWQEAMDYAESIGMRLPTKFELQAIAESTDKFNNLGWCWSSSTQSNGTTNAWSVFLTSGNTNNNNKTIGRSVLCVAP